MNSIRNRAIKTVNAKLITHNKQNGGREKSLPHSFCEIEVVSKKEELLKKILDKCIGL